MRKLFAAIAAIALSSQATAWADTVAGDSIGVGVALASGMRNVAKGGVPIDRAIIDRQLARTSGKVWLFLGTNSMPGSVPVGDVRAIVSFAHARNLTLVWVGPPCMNKSRRFGRYVPRFDAGLNAVVTAAGARYVSLNRAEHCSLPRLPDGVHFTSPGYHAIWNLVRK